MQFGVNNCYLYRHKGNYLIPCKQIFAKKNQFFQSFLNTHCILHIVHNVNYPNETLESNTE